VVKVKVVKVKVVKVKVVKDDPARSVIYPDGMPGTAVAPARRRAVIRRPPAPAVLVTNFYFGNERRPIRFQFRRIVIAGEEFPRRLSNRVLELLCMVPYLSLI